MKTLHLIRKKEVVEDTGLELPIYLKLPQDSIYISHVYYKILHDGSRWRTIRIEEWYDGGSIQIETCDNFYAPNIHIPELGIPIEDFVIPKEEFDSLLKWVLDFVNPD